MKKISVDLIIIILSSLLLLGGVGLSYFAFYKIQPAYISDSQEKKQFLEGEAKDQSSITFYTLPKIQTNIEHHTSRLIQAEMTVAIEPEKGVTTEEIKNYEALIVDLIINAVAQSTIEQLDNVSSKIILAEKIKNGTNEIMKKKAVKSVLFSTFSVQLQ